VWIVLFAETFAAKVTVPVDVGVGPSAVVLNGAAMRQQPVYGALRFSLQAVIDKKTLKENRKRIPKEYLSMVQDMDEVRITPKIWLVSLGWESRAHIPQELGGFGISDAPLADLWHVGHGYLKLHYRFPYTVRL